jgi:hypothetical protein
MPVYEYSEEKNQKLRDTRQVGFEQVIEEIESGRMIRMINHPNQARYPGQVVIVVAIGEYACAVPAIVRGEYVFLKTIYPSRKLNKKLKETLT